MAAVIPLHRDPPEVEADASLVARSSRGDRRAFDLLFDRHHQRVYRFALRMMLGHVADAEDVVQATFVTAWERSSRYDDRASVTSWLLGIAANKARHRRRGFLRRRRLGDAVALAPHAPAADPEQRAVDRDRLARLERGILELPDRLREAFVLAELEHMPCGDIAEALGLPVGTVYRRISEARARLRPLLDPDTP